jgi:hypothetical protein
MSVDNENDQEGGHAVDTVKATYTVNSRATADEESPLLESSPQLTQQKVAVTGVKTILAILLLGMGNTKPRQTSPRSREQFDLTYRRRVDFQCRRHSGPGGDWPYFVRVRSSS